LERKEITLNYLKLFQAFSAVRQDIAKQSNEHEMIDFIVDKFKSWTGIGQLMAAVKKKGRSGVANDPMVRVEEKQRLEAQLDLFPERFIDDM